MQLFQTCWHLCIILDFTRRGGAVFLHLVERLKQKKEEAYLEVMDAYGDYLLRSAFLLLKDYQLAEDTVQDTFVMAFQKLDQLEDEEKLKSWLTTILLNRCRSQMRKWSWKVLLAPLDLIERTKADNQALNPENALLFSEWHESISTSIQQLDYKYREVITLFYFNEMKIKDIALFTNTNENTVKSKLKRARLLLKEILPEGSIDI